MAEANLSWGEAPRDLMERWPKDENGEPEKAAFLTGTFEADAQADMLISKLLAYGIPAFRRYDRDGTLGKVVLGFSGYGVGLFVPESLLEDARALIEPIPAAVFENEIYPDEEEK